MNYEILLKPNRKRGLKAVLGFLVILTLGIVGYIIAMKFWDEYVSYHISFRGRRRPGGWPYWLQVASGWMIAIGGLGSLFTVLTVMRKKSSFGLNKDGIMVDLLGWNQVFIGWNEITSLEEVDNVHGRGIVIHFNSITDLIERYGDKQKAYLTREHITKNRPVAVNRSTAIGDIESFNQKLKAYFKAAKGQL